MYMTLLKMESVMASVSTTTIAKKWSLFIPSKERRFSIFRGQSIFVPSAADDNSWADGISSYDDIATADAISLQGLIIFYSLSMFRSEKQKTRNKIGCWNGVCLHQKSRMLLKVFWIKDNHLPKRIVHACIHWGLLQQSITDSHHWLLRL